MAGLKALSFADIILGSRELLEEAENDRTINSRIYRSKPQKSNKTTIIEGYATPSPMG
jgi:precorrin-6B methylase 1